MHCDHSEQGSEIKLKLPAPSHIPLASPSPALTFCFLSCFFLSYLLISCSCLLVVRNWNWHRAPCSNTAHWRARRCRRQNKTESNLNTLHAREDGRRFSCLAINASESEKRKKQTQPNHSQTAPEEAHPSQKNSTRKKGFSYPSRRQRW